MKIIIDTNIIISAALSPNGKPAEVIKLIEDNEQVQVYYSKEIFAEYEEVLSRAKFNINEDKRNRTLSLIENIGILIEPTVSIILLPDEDDRIYYDAAKEAEATLITGNLKHFPEEDFIMTPSQFIEGLEV
jgi:putative PIN family toxin of toxin-antitoxin system